MKKILLIILLLINLTACQKQAPKLLSKQQLDCGFDTVCTLYAYANEDEFNKYFNTMVSSFAYYHQLFDIYNEYEGINNLKTINDQAGKGPLKVDPIIIELLLKAKQINEISNGAFDITNGSLLKIWHNYRDEGKILNSNGEYGNLPTKEELNQASKHHGFDSIIINEKENTVEILDEELSLDVGGIAKGFACEKVAIQLKQKGLNNGAVNAGGNQRIIGSKVDGKGWNVGIQDPRAESLLGVVSDSNIAIVNSLSDVSVVTSGDYQNYYYAQDEKRYSHIIDPFTLYPANLYNSVSIITKDSGLADALSTSLFVLSYEEGLKFIENISEKYDAKIGVIWISDNPIDDSSILSISKTKQYLTYTDNLKDIIVTK